MRMQTSTLTGAALDWAVATAEGHTNLRRGVFSQVLIMDPPRVAYGAVEFSGLNYSTDWAHGGPIIEHEGISVQTEAGAWSAYFRDNLFKEDGSDHFSNGQTALIAAMRCHVASKFGAEIDIPEELDTQ